MMRKIIVVPPDLLDEVGPLGDLPLESRTARNAAEALVLAQTFVPDLILFDSGITGMTPADFCRAARSEPHCARTRLLMLTARVSGSLGALGGMLDGLADADTDGHLLAPVDKFQLVTTMAALIGMADDSPVVDGAGMLAVLSQQDTESIFVTVLALGDSRMQVEAQDHLRVGVPVRARLVLPATRNALTLTCTGPCPVDELRLRYELRFVGLTDADATALRQFVVARTGRSP